MLLSIDYDSQYFLLKLLDVLTSCTENIEMTDYLKEGDIGFKKPKVRPMCIS